MFSYNFCLEKCNLMLKANQHTIICAVDRNRQPKSCTHIADHMKLQPICDILTYSISAIQHARYADFILKCNFMLLSIATIYTRISFGIEARKHINSIRIKREVMVVFIIILLCDYCFFFSFALFALLLWAATDTITQTDSATELFFELQ